MYPSLAKRLVAGASGAVAVTLVNEAARKRFARAPRMDIVGVRGVEKVLHWLGREAPSRRRSYWVAMLGDLASNAVYYSLAGMGRARRPFARGVFLGALAGVGALFLTPKLGLGRRPVKRTAQTAWMTFGWYLLGGAVSGAVLQRSAAADLAPRP